MKNKNIRIRIYSKLKGVEDFVGINFNKLELQAKEAVRAYEKAGIEATYIGRI